MTLYCLSIEFRHFLILFSLLNDVITIVGGGDSSSAIKNFSLVNEFSHISTGGGASLELLSGNNLPAIYALEV